MLAEHGAKLWVGDVYVDKSVRGMGLFQKGESTEGGADIGAVVVEREEDVFSARYEGPAEDVGIGGITFDQSCAALGCTIGGTVDGMDDEQAANEFCGIWSAGIGPSAGGVLLKLVDELLADLAESGDDGVAAEDAVEEEASTVEEELQGECEGAGCGKNYSEYAGDDEEVVGGVFELSDLFIWIVQEKELAAVVGGFENTAAEAGFVAGAHKDQEADGEASEGREDGGKPEAEAPLRGWAFAWAVGGHMGFRKSRVGGGVYDIFGRGIAGSARAKETANRRVR
jgi:hypothetical protein